MREDKFKDLMKLSKVELPFNDFEENLMFKIEMAEKSQSIIKKSHSNALIFFALGTLFGMGSNYIFSKYLVNLTGNPSNLEFIQTLSLIVYVPLIVLFCLKLIELYKLHRPRQWE